MEIKRCYDTIIGASVGENQLYPVHTSYNVYSGDVTGLTINVTDGYINITGTASADAQITVLPIAPTENSVPANHVSLMLCEGWNGFSWSRVGFGSKTLPYYMNKHTATFYVATRIFITSGTTYNIHARFSATDLTAELGSSIADYIYSLESATAGSGIAKLREWGFLRGYQAFNSGSIESVEVTGKVVRGFNQWDEEWEVGYINPTTGEATSANDRIRTKNFNPCLPNTAYYVKDPTSSNNVRIFYYDADKNFVSETGWKGNQILTTPSNAYFFKFIMGASYGTTYNHDICINLSNPDRNGEYEAYTSQSYDYGDDTLRGIFKLDANNNLYAYGDRKTADGLITRKMKLVDLGSLYWTYANGRFTAASTDNPSITDVKQYGNTVIANAICAVYTTASRESIADKQLSMHYSGQNYINVMDSGYSDASTFKTAMSGVYLVCELATPTTEQGDPFPSPQVCYPDGTEEYVTSNGVPVGHETRYEL